MMNSYALTHPAPAGLRQRPVPVHCGLRRGCPVRLHPVHPGLPVGQERLAAARAAADQDDHRPQAHPADDHGACAGRGWPALGLTCAEGFIVAGARCACTRRGRAHAALGVCMLRPLRCPCVAAPAGAGPLRWRARCCAEMMRNAPLPMMHACCMRAHQGRAPPPPPPSPAAQLHGVPHHHQHQRHQHHRREPRVQRGGAAVARAAPAAGGARHCHAGGLLCLVFECCIQRVGASLCTAEDDTPGGCCGARTGAEASAAGAHAAHVRASGVLGGVAVCVVRLPRA